MVKNTSPILRELREASTSEPLAVSFMERQRWGTSPVCPHCGGAKVYQMMSTKNAGQRNKDYRWRCHGCRKMYTVRTGTIFEETRLPMRVWIFAFWKACASKKGISALQLSREMEITHKSALFVLRRIRHGLGTDATTAPKLTGTVEADEVFLGGHRRGDKRGRPTPESHKTPVLGMVQRQGDVRFRMMQRLTADQIGEVLAENADLTCRLITDEMSSYRRPGSAFTGGHEFVTHSAREYVRKGTDIHSNTIEGVFSLIRRGVMVAPLGN
jgi:transposase-like protein